MEYEFELHRSMILNVNATKGKHWGSTAGQTSDLKMLGNGHRLSHKLPRMQRCRIDVDVTYPDKRQHDVGNLYLTLKAYVDGLVNNGKGILHDDNDAFLEGPFARWTGRAPVRKDFYHLKVTITELPWRDIEKGAVGPALAAVLASAGVPGLV